MSEIDGPHPGEARAINGGGQAVGYLNFFGGSPRAFLYSKGTRWFLQDLVPGLAAAGWSALADATGVNDSGLIIGQGIIRNERHAFLLEPIR